MKLFNTACLCVMSITSGQKQSRLMAYVQSTELWIKMQLLTQAPGCTLIYMYTCMYVYMYIYLLFTK